MASESFTPAQLDKLVGYAAKQLGTSPEQLKTAFAQGGLSGISSALSPEEAKKAEALLKDKEKTAALMNSPAVQQLLAQLLGDK